MDPIPEKPEPAVTEEEISRRIAICRDVRAPRPVDDAAEAAQEELARRIANDSKIGFWLGKQAQFEVQDQLRREKLRATIKEMNMQIGPLGNAVRKAEADLRRHLRSIEVAKKGLVAKPLPSYIRARLQTRKHEIERQVQRRAISTLKEEFRRKWNI